MRILLICDGLDGTYGWSRYTKNLKQELARRGHTVLTCTPTQKGGDIDGLPTAIQMMTRPYLSFSLKRVIERAVRTHAIDIIHFTVEPYALALPLLPKHLQERSLLTIHGNYGIRPLRWWASRWLARRMLERVNQCIVVSRYTRDVVAKEIMGNAVLHASFLNKTHVISNGIPMPPIKTLKKAKHDVHQILFVGGVKGSKGVMEAIRGCAVYKQRYNGKFHFTIAGSAEGHTAYGNALRPLIMQSDMQHDVSFPGRVDDNALDDLYTKADVFLMPSITTEDTFEGFGLVYIEANAHGIPVIGPRSSGAAEAIANGESGYTVDPEDAEGIAERLYKILDKREIPLEQCRAWAEQHSIDRMTDEVLCVYEKIEKRTGCS